MPDSTCNLRARLWESMRTCSEQKTATRSLTGSLFATRIGCSAQPQQAYEAAIGLQQVQAVASSSSMKLRALHPDAGLRVQNREHLPATGFEVMQLP